MDDEPENPFEASVCEGAGAFDEAQDVPSLNAHAAEVVLEQTRRVAADHRTRCLLMLGQPGLGKSHVLARIRDHTYQSAFPVVVRSYSRPGSIFRSLIRQITWGLLSGHSRVKGDLLRELVDTAIRAIYDDPGQKLRLDAILAGAEGEQAPMAVRQRRLIEACIDFFEPTATRVLGDRQALPLYSADAVRTVLSYRLIETSVRDRVRHWITGRDLSEEDLAALGLSRSLDDEETAKEALAALGIFGAMTRPILLCLDQTEQLESSPEESGIEAMARVITHLRELPGFSIVFSCLRDKWNLGYATQLPSSYRDRITEGGNARVDLGYPTPDEGLEIIRRRLGGALAPFTESNLGAFLDRHHPSPRLLLQECSRSYARWQREGRQGILELPLEGASPDLQEPGPAGTATSWESALARVPPPEGLDPKATEEAVALVLTGLGLKAGGKLLTQLTPAKASKLDLLVKAGSRRVGFVFDESANGTKFAALLKALLKELEAGGLDHLVVWRRDEPPPGWKAGRARWAELQARKDVTVHRPDPETLRRLRAFRQLCARLQADGRDHGAEAAARLPEALGACPEIQDTLRLLGTSLPGTAATPTAPAAPPPPPSRTGGAVRDEVARLVKERKVMRRDQLLSLVAEACEAQVEGAVFERALDDLEAGGVLWRLEAAKEDYVVFCR